MARRGKYTADIPDKVRAFAECGYTEKEMAAYLGINQGTLERYKNQYPEVIEALRVGKVIPDIKVEQSLYKLAMGYDVTETKTVKLGDVVLRTEVTTKQVQPSTTACIFWLKNRRPDLWRDVSRLEVLDINKALKAARLEAAKGRAATVDGGWYGEAEEVEEVKAITS